MARKERDYVPIDGERVKQGLDARGLTQREAGRRMARRHYGVSVTRKDENAFAMAILKIVRGKSRRCDMRFRQQLSKTLDLPVRWLSGELKHLPHTFDLPVYIAERSTSKGQAEYRRWKAGVAAHDSVLRPSPLAPAVERATTNRSSAEEWRALAASVLADVERQRNTDAEPGQQIPNRRQIAEYHFWKELDPAFERLATSESEEARRLAVCLKWLVDPAWWRRCALKPDQADAEESLPSHLRRTSESQEESEAREALMIAFLYILKPFRMDRAGRTRAGLELAFFERVTALQDVLKAETAAQQPHVRQPKRGRR